VYETAPGLTELAEGSLTSPVVSMPCLQTCHI
jgi:hypothetical protein